jgi:hypothetical protein
MAIVFTTGLPTYKKVGDSITVMGAEVTITRKLKD